MQPTEKSVLFLVISQRKEEKREGGKGNSKQIGIQAVGLQAGEAGGAGREDDAI